MNQFIVEDLKQSTELKAMIISEIHKLIGDKYIDQDKFIELIAEFISFNVFDRDWDSISSDDRSMAFADLLISINIVDFESKIDRRLIYRLIRNTSYFKSLHLTSSELEQAKQFFNEILIGQIYGEYRQRIDLADIFFNHLKIINSES